MHIVSAEAMYKIDQSTTESFGIDEKMLMENAGRAAADKIIRHISKKQKIVVLAGGGSNGGDGFVIARTLVNHGYTVEVAQTVADEKITGTPLFHKELYQKLGGKVHVGTEESLQEKIFTANVLVDCLFGIGIKGPLKAPFDRIVDWLNQSSAMTISIDIPSGIPSGEAAGEFSGVQADLTIIIEAPKPSVFIQQTAPYYGEWEVASIGIPFPIVEKYSSGRVWQEEDVHNSLPSRTPFSHKGTHGKGLVIGGGRDMPGSVTLTTSAALRSGAGLITAAVPEAVIPVLASHIKEATFEVLESEDGRISGSASLDISPYDGVAIGMGMGRAEATARFTRDIVAKAHVPVLIDADGLHHLKPELNRLKEADGPRILTPHPGEMAMLTDTSVKEVLADPFQLSREFARKYGIFLVLKGAFTIVTTPEGKQFVNTTGNAGLAKGGTGDALSGILLAMMMKEQSTQEALSNGCFLHGRVAEILTEKEHSSEDLLASDLIDGLASAFHSIHR